MEKAVRVWLCICIAGSLLSMEQGVCVYVYLHRMQFAITGQHT